MNQSNVPPHKLTLAEGEQCYIVRNLLPEEALVNNAAIEILQIRQYVIKVRLLASDALHYIPRINFNLELHKQKCIILRKQFPIRASYAKTYNRCQGSTYDKCAIDLREEPFSHGQLLVTRVDHPRLQVYYKAM